MDAGPTSDLDALRNILDEAHAILDDITLPQGRAERCKELISTAKAIADRMNSAPAAALGSKGGKRTLAKFGPDHFRQLVARRKTRAGGRPRKQSS